MESNDKSDKSIKSGIKSFYKFMDTLLQICIQSPNICFGIWDEHFFFKGILCSNDILVSFCDSKLTYIYRQRNYSHRLLFSLQLVKFIQNANKTARIRAKP